MTTPPRLEPDIRVLQRALSKMIVQLEEKDLDQVRQCYAGQHQFATNWIVNWSLEHVVCAGSVEDYGLNRTLFIPSNSVSSDLRRFEQTAAAAAAAGENMKMFDFGTEYMNGVSLYALQQTMLSTALDTDKNIDYLLLPLNTAHYHWSLLVVDVSRRLVVHMDSLPGSGHHELALKATNMLTASGLLRRFVVKFREMSLPVQPGGALCGYCLLRSAAAYSAGGLEHAAGVQFDLPLLRETMLRIMSVAKSHEANREFDRRLDNYWLQ